MAVHLSEHFTYKKLFKAVLPSIFMMIFTSIYGVVDGLFISNFVGKTAFAAINLIMPVLMILDSIGFMLGAGGSALVAKTLGEGDEKRANEMFSMVMYFTSLNDGLISALISFARTLLFQSICILVMPNLFGTNGIWLSVVVAETLALIVSIACLITKKKKYRY